MEERRLFDKLMAERHGTILSSLARIETMIKEDREIVAQHIKDDDRRLGKIERGMIVLQWAYALGSFFAVGYLTKIYFATR